MSDRYADHDAAWHRDMETEAAAQEPREDVEALRLKHKIEDALAATQDIDAVHALDALLARLEQTERALQTELRAVNTLRGVVEDAEARAEAAERERDTVDEDYRRDTAILEERWRNASRRHEDEQKAQDEQFRRAEAAERVEESLKQMLAASTIKRDEYQARAEAAERALREIADMEPNAGSENQPVFIARAALASGEGEKKRVLINTRTGERREWEPGLVLQAEGPLEWELREE